MVVAGLEMWSLVQNKGDSSTQRTLVVGFPTKKTLLPLHPWWLDLKTKWYERTPAWPYSRNWQEPKSCGALLEWLELANTEWLVSWMGPHVHPSHQRCTPDIEPRLGQRYLSPSYHTTCVGTGFEGPVEYGGGALPNSRWRSRCHLNTSPRMHWWRDIICHPSVSWRL